MKTGKLSKDRLEKILKYLLIITIALIWGQSMIKREISQIESDSILRIVNPFSDVEIGDVTSDAYWHISDVFRKIAHLIEYGILGCELVAYKAIKTKNFINKKEFINLMFMGLSVGLIDETIQAFSKRGSLVTDVWIDTLGICIGLLLGRLVVRKVRNRDSKS